MKKRSKEQTITKVYPFGIEAKICRSIFKKAKGLMFSLNPKPLLFICSKEESIPIHMLFVFFPLLVIWLDKNKRIVDLKILKPFTMHNPKSYAQYVLEIPFVDVNLHIKKQTEKLKIGSKLKFRE